jgi:hypothetical protein
MNRDRKDNETETAIRRRMAASRETLLAANRPSPSVLAATKATPSSAGSFIALLVEAPRVTLLLALCISAVVLGPRRTIGVAARSWIAAWLGGTVRNVVRKNL